MELPKRLPMRKEFEANAQCIYEEELAMDRQLRKGLLEYCVLAAIREEDSYGYKMIEDISPCIEISESTLYPILRRLEEAGKVTSYNTEFHNRIRKYFHITDSFEE